MTNKEILEGLSYRIKNLNKTLKVCQKYYMSDRLIDETIARIDELESVYNWIKENKNEK